MPRRTTAATQTDIARVIRAAKEVGDCQVFLMRAREAWVPIEWNTTGSVVYFIKINRLIKIGFSTDLSQRLKSFRAILGSQPVLIGTLPGGRREETRLHQAFRATRVTNELFQFDGRLEGFIATLSERSLEAAWEYLDQTDPDRVARRMEKQARERRAEAQKTRAQEAAYFASLVAERKRTLGW